MSLDLESALVATLKARCPRVSPMVAPLDTAMPYATYQHIGGRPLGYMDNTAADKRHALVQVNVYAATAAAALQLLQDMAADLRAHAALVATPENEPIADPQPDFERYGYLQDFSIVGAR